MKDTRLTQARARIHDARKGLMEAETELTDALVDDVQECFHQHEGTLRLTLGLVKEIPDRPSLDHNGTKREILKELEEMGRRIRALHDKAAKLRRSP